MKIRPAILIIEADKILTMQYRYGNEDVYNLPGGNVELNESMPETIVREMVEELGVNVSVGELLFVGEVHFEEKKQQTLHCIFQGNILSGTPMLNPAETTAKAIKWLKINELDKINMYPNIGTALQKYIFDKERNLYLGKIAQQWF